MLEASAVAAVLALLASVAYGTSDFSAGVAARRVSVIAVAWWGHVLGTALLVALAVGVVGAPPPGSLVFGAAAGVLAGVGLVLFYGALASGEVSVVTPLAATGVAVPVTVGLFRGEVPGPAGWVGLAVIAAAVLVLSVAKAEGSAEPTPPCVGARPGCPQEQARRSPRLPPVVAALLAALCFGSAFVLVEAGAAGGEPLWVSAGLQAGGLLGLVPIVAAGPLRRVRVARRDLSVLLPAGVFAAAGDVALSLALDVGELGIVSVLGSLDAVVSVLLAQAFLREHLGWRRASAVAAALAGGLLLATG